MLIGYARVSTQDQKYSLEDQVAELKAAETLEEINEKFPWNKDYNQIGLHYSSAGYTMKALEYYTKAFENNAKSYTAFNLGYNYKYIDENENVCKFLSEKVKSII